jgi:hypothetical protein
MEEHEHTAECVHGHERAPAEAKKPKGVQPGLLDRIKAAKTPEEMNALILESTGPEYATVPEGTRRKWLKAIAAFHALRAAEDAKSQKAAT